MPSPAETGHEFSPIWAGTEMKRRREVFPGRAASVDRGFTKRQDAKGGNLNLEPVYSWGALN
jgi:hypothetical protein